MGGNTAIRYRLILSAAFAVGAVWIGVLLQYQELQAQQHRFAEIRSDLEASRGLGRLALALARERGQSQGLLGAKGEGRSELRDDVAKARSSADSEASHVPSRASAREFVLKDELRSLRASIDADRIDLATSFGAYTVLIGDLNLSASKRLSSAMLQIGMPYEHLNALREGIEYAGQGRGLLQGRILLGEVSDAELAALREKRFVAELFLRRSAALSPDGLQALSGARWADWDAEWRDFFADPAVYISATSGDRWWSIATRAIESLQADLDAQLESTITEAESRIVAIQRRAMWAAITMVVLGVLTLGLLLSTLSRVIRGLGSLVHGIDRVATQGDLAVRIDASQGDEFGQIGDSVNRLVDTLEHLMAEKEARAESDGLTGLLNRAGLDRHLAARTNLQRKGAVAFGLMVLDIDHFKRINDEHGHLEGDRVLTVVAGVLRRAVRPDDIIGRWGGEEFLVILGGGPEVDLAVAAERVRACIAALDVGLGRPVTVSIGATFWMPGEVLKDSFQRADSALYVAKSQGRNRATPRQAPLAEAGVSPSQGPRIDEPTKTLRPRRIARQQKPKLAECRHTDMPHAFGV